jgi:hypothetical protein
MLSVEWFYRDQPGLIYDTRHIVDNIIMKVNTPLPNHIPIPIARFNLTSTISCAIGCEMRLIGSCLFLNLRGVFSGVSQNRQSHDNLAGEGKTLPAFSSTSPESLHRLTRGTAAQSPARLIVPDNLLAGSKHPADELTEGKLPRSRTSLNCGV